MVTTGVRGFQHKFPHEIDFYESFPKKFWNIGQFSRAMFIYSPISPFFYNMSTDSPESKTIFITLPRMQHAVSRVHARSIVAAMLGGDNAIKSMQWNRDDGSDVGSGDTCNVEYVPPRFLNESIPNDTLDDADKMRRKLSCNDSHKAIQNLLEMAGGVPVQLPSERGSD